MIAQGTDGASRGDLSNGVMSGKDMLHFVPLDLGVQERAPDLVAWFAGAGGGGGGFGLPWNLRAGFMIFILRMEILSGARRRRSPTPHWNAHFLMSCLDDLSLAEASDESCGCDVHCACRIFVVGFKHA
jgi:hypothetical protein